MLLDVNEIKAKLEGHKSTPVARDTGVTRQAIYQVLAGKAKPSYDMLEKLTAYFSRPA